MNPAVVAALCTGSFVAGVVFGKAVLSEASSIKAHITAEIQKLKGELGAELGKAASKL